MLSDKINNISDGGLAGVITQGIKNYMKDVHTCLPGKIVNFDGATQLAEVQLLITRSFSMGDPQPLPLLINVPVWFPRAGGFNITFPVAKDDQCLVLFAERALDRWITEGDLQPPHDMRMHSLSDALCLVGLSSTPQAITNFDVANFQIRNEEKDQIITLKPNKDIDVVTGGVEIKMINASNTINITAPTTINIDTPLATFTGDIQVDGSINVDVDLDVAGSTGLGSTVTSNGKDISDTHKHSGVTTGGSNTGDPI